jgi:hypothetical protein
MDGGNFYQYASNIPTCRVDSQGTTSESSWNIYNSIGVSTYLPMVGLAMAAALNVASAKTPSEVIAAIRIAAVVVVGLGVSTGFLTNGHSTNIHANAATSAGSAVIGLALESVLRGFEKRVAQAGASTAMAGKTYAWKAAGLLFFQVMLCEMVLMSMEVE